MEITADTCGLKRTVTKSNSSDDLSITSGGCVIIQHARLKEMEKRFRCSRLSLLSGIPRLELLKKSTIELRKDRRYSRGRNTTDGYLNIITFFIKVINNNISQLFFKY